MKVFGYVRVSGESQVEKDGPIRQGVAIAEFCKANGFVCERTYSDPGVSGTVEGMDRPGFFDMIEAARDTGVCAVVVEKLERLARDLIVSEMIIREFRTRGIALYAADQGKVDLVSTDSDPSRKFIRQIFAAVAEYEKSCLVLKLRAARKRMKEKTGRCEGRKPYGKNNPEKRLLQLILNMRSSGCSWRGIATLLKQEGVTKRNGSTRWTGSEAFEIFAHRIPKELKEMNGRLLK